MELFFIWPALAALFYAIAAILTKRALAEGAGVMRYTFLCNLFYVFVFGAPALFAETAPNWSEVLWPIAAGVLFLIGQVLTVAAIRVGDVSVQSPLMGSKVVFVAVLSVLSGAEAVRTSWWAAAGLTAVAIFLLGFSRWKGSRSLWLGITCALSASFFFAASDIFVIAHASSFGSNTFFAVMMGVQCLLSFAFIPFFQGSIRKIPHAAVPWLLVSLFFMAAQAMTMNYALACYQHATAFNVLYSSRGLWSILLLGLFGRYVQNIELVGNRRLVIQRLAGASLLMVAVILVLSD